MSSMIFLNVVGSIKHHVNFALRTPESIRSLPVEVVLGNDPLELGSDCRVHQTL